MKWIRAALALALIWVSAGSRPVRAQRTAADGEGATGKPVVIAVTQHDLSPNLRDIPPFRPAEPELPREFHEDREREEERARAPWIEAEARRGVVKDRVAQTAAVPRRAVPAGLSFDGIGSGIHGFQVGGAPPDPNGAVGASQYVQSVNSSMAVYDKHTGALLLGPLDFRTLYAGFGGLCETNGGSDPVVLYDRMAERWIVSILVSANNGGPNSNFECFAVSTSSDATGSYHRYAIPFGSSLNDFPKLGVWPDAYYFAANPFDQAQGGRLLGRNLCAIDREAAIDGAPLTLICFLVPLAATSGAVLPTDMDGGTPPPPGTPNFFYVLGGNFASLRYFKFHVDFATPADSTLMGPFDIPVAPFNRLCPGSACVPQAGSPQLLSSIGDVPNFRVAYRNYGSHESIVLNHSVSTAGVAGVRWYEIREPNGAAAVFQQGTFSPDGTGRWMGSIATDKAGNIGLGYSASGPTMNPAVGITGRVPADPPGNMGTETIAFAGAGAQTPTLDRWGDYSAMTVDPQDDCTFWYTSEYIPANGTFNWRTRIVQLHPARLREPAAGRAQHAQPVLRQPERRHHQRRADGDLHQRRPRRLDARRHRRHRRLRADQRLPARPGRGGELHGRGHLHADRGRHPTGHADPDRRFHQRASPGRAHRHRHRSGRRRGRHQLRGRLHRHRPDPERRRRPQRHTPAPDRRRGQPGAQRVRHGSCARAGLHDRLHLPAHERHRRRLHPHLPGQRSHARGPGGRRAGLRRRHRRDPQQRGREVRPGQQRGRRAELDRCSMRGGVPPNVPSLNLIPSGINLHTGDVFYAHVTYDGNTLAWSITNASTGKAFAGSTAVDIPGEVGAATAFVGFTGGTGGGANTAIQDILTWTFQTPGVVAPFVALSPRTLAFGSQETGTTSAPQVVTVTNHGPGLLTFNSITTEGDFVQTNDCPATLAEGTACAVSVAFAPAAAGTRQGTLRVSDNAFNGVQRASAIGTGLQAGVPAVVDYRGGFVAEGLSLNNGASISGTRLRITTNNTGLARSAFTLRPVNVASFNADFTFQNTNATADGFTFTIQRNAPTALGATGGGLGYAGIPNSVAVKFDIFNSGGEGTSSTGLYRNGAMPSVPSLDLTPSGIILRSTDVFYVHFAYDGAVLSWTITSSRSGATFAASAPIDIPATIGGPAAFVGFTGGTGGLTATQDILTWTFQTAGTTGPHALLAPGSLSFGIQTVGTTSAPQPLVLSNTGPGTLNIASITAGPGFAQTNDCGTALAEAATCTIEVTFHPTVSGAQVATLTVADDGAISPQTARLSGVGAVPGGAVTVNYGGGFTAAGLTLNGAAINGGRLRLTDGGAGQARTAFFTTPVDVRGFVNDFSFLLTNANADGFTFTVQGNAPTAVGGNGGGLGYGPPNPGVPTGGIPNSVAVKFDLYDSEGEGANSTGLFTNGAFPGTPATDLTGAGLNLHGGTVLNVHMTYDSTILTWTISDPSSGNSLTSTAEIDIPAFVGGPTAFVGFTGGTGGLTAIQDILTWTYQTASTVPLVTLAPSRLTFGSSRGGGRAMQVVTLTNRGPGTLSIASITVTGDFSQVNDCGTSLAENASCKIGVSFVPTGPGTRLGTLTVMNDAFFNPQSTALVGIAPGPDRPSVGVVRPAIAPRSR